MKIFITGCSGFVGQHLLNKVKNSHFNIGALSKNEFLYDNVKSFVGDVTDFKTTRSAILDFKPNVILHLAGSTSRSKKIEDLDLSIDSNVKGTLNILKSIPELKDFMKLIVIGTAEEYGKNRAPYSEKIREAPVSCYSLSKTMQAHMVEMFSRSYGVPCILLRPGVIYGPGQNETMFLPSLICSLNKGKDFSMTSGNQSRDFIYISDLIDALLCAIRADVKNFEIINIGSGVPILISDLADMVGEMLEKRELINKGALESRTDEITDYCLNIEKAKNILNWYPKVVLKSGLLKTLEFYRKSHESV